MSRTGLWDSHAHLDSDYFTSDRHELITNLQAELDGIVNPGCDAETSAFAVELAEKYDKQKDKVLATKLFKKV